MSNDLTGKQVLVNVLVAAVGAIVGAVTTALLNLIITGKISVNSWWILIGGGLLGALLVFWLYSTFRPKKLFYGCKVAIRTHDHNFVTADLNRDHQLFGRGKSIQTSQIFEIIDADMPFSQVPNRLVHYGDRVGFKALINESFVGADLAHDKQLTTWAAELRGWETFTLCLPQNATSFLRDSVQFGNSFALKAYNENYVECIITGDGRLLADASRIDKWETFVFVHPTYLSLHAIFGKIR